MPEDILVRHCSPTLAGIKTGSLFTCAFDDPAELKPCLRGWNTMLGGKGLRVMPMRWKDGRALIYVYRPSQLKCDLQCSISETKGAGKVNIHQIFADFKAGLGFLRTSKAVQTVSLIGLVINFGLMPLSVFQTPYVYDYLKMGPEVLSLIKVLMVAGMMTGAAVTPKLLKTLKARLSVLAGAGMGAAIACMYVAVQLGNEMVVMSLLIISMFLVGAGGGVLNVIIGGCMMNAVPKVMLGRVSALNSALMQASMPVGSLLCSILVIPMNVVQLFLLFGVCTIVFYVWMGLTHRLDCLDEPGKSGGHAV